MSSIQKIKGLQGKKKGNQPSQSKDIAALVTSDDRFKAVHFDPRFAAVSKKDKKFKIDSRFSKVLSDPKFKVVAQVDKYGRKIDAPKGNKEMEDFYYVEDGEGEDNGQQEQQEEEEEVVEAPKKGKDAKKQKKINKMVEEKPQKNVKAEKAAKVKGDKKGQADKVNCFNEEGKFEWNEESSSSSDFEQTGVELAEDANEEIWEDEDEQVQEGDASKRLAMMNYDWENIKAGDIMLFLTSFLPRNGYIKSVTTYPSDFGLQRMADEERYGPQHIWKDDYTLDEKEINDMDIDGTNQWIFNEDVNADIDTNKLRKYEKDRLKYYYSVIECDSVATAKHLYDNCDGLEMELTSIKVDLRYIPDDMVFKNAPKETCIEAPAQASVNCFLNRAVQHTNVKLTWEEPKFDRFKELEKKIDSADFDKIDLSKYIADTDSSADSEDAEEEVAKKRDLLLGGLSGSWKDDFNKSKKKNREGEIVIKFNSGFDELGNKILEKSKPEKKEKPAKKGARIKVKEDDDYFAEKDEEEEVEPKDMKKKQQELELLIDEEETKRKGEFKLDTNDERFKAIYNRTDLAIDPTSKFYVAKTNAKVLEEQVRRRKKVKTH